MKVYMLLSCNHGDKISDNISIFESETDALQSFCVKILHITEEWGWNSNQSTEIDIYLDILSLYNNGHYRAIATIFNNWLSNHPEVIFNVCLEVNNYEIIPSKQGSIINKLQDVPCKFCGRNVSENEPVCWCCGVSNPAVK